ncbi:hypothetical protein BS50DRAFT_144009 [Corynespora cassiicola Philippines]|uniref:Uncharacterized protein n=1 Tax=Corynespora cassiicola Philippines TaxID=1448308 RepID=A0A2T2N874_CORCC|nr:hypothetical protein BS50DRAFT_144009 [Corynespora cassiicola Philippines]
MRRLTSPHPKPHSFSNEPLPVKLSVHQDACLNAIYHPAIEHHHNGDGFNRSPGRKPRHAERRIGHAHSEDTSRARCREAIRGAHGGRIRKA